MKVTEKKKKKLMFRLEIKKQFNKNLIDFGNVCIRIIYCVYLNTVCVQVYN